MYIGLSSDLGNWLYSYTIQPAYVCTYMCLCVCVCVLNCVNYPLNINTMHPFKSRNKKNMLCFLV